MKQISLNNLFELLNTLKNKYDVYIPVRKNNHRFYEKFSKKNDNIILGEVRTFEPLKTFFSRAREIVAEGYKSDVSVSNKKPIAILGVKACDLKGFKIQDFVFKEGDYQDPFYIKAREENLIISCDCTCAITTCFCLALGLKPHPQEFFDINLSEIKDGFIVEIGSNKGEEIIKQNSGLFQDATADSLAEREKIRNRVIEEVGKNLKENEVPYEDSFKNMIEKNFESKLWEDEAKTCVECGACNTICPTCHCFLLYDEKDEDKMTRLRMWDSCMIKDFARVAGGANPRHRLWMRLRNRFEKKFDFFPKAANIYACTGCGRCISACPAKIDIRKVLNRMATNA